MEGFVELAEQVEERATERMSFRVKPSIKAAIQYAAAISGMTVSAFARSAAYKAALEVREANEQIVRQGKDAADSLDLTDSPPPTEVLRGDGV